MRDEQFVSSRHVEVEGRRHPAQQLQTGVEQCRSWFAGINIERPPIVENDTEIAIAARAMVPRRPIHHYRWFLCQKRRYLALDLRVGTDHAMRIDNGFGNAGRAGGEEKLGDGFSTNSRGGSFHGLAPATIAA